MKASNDGSSYMYSMSMTTSGGGGGFGGGQGMGNALNYMPEEEDGAPRTYTVGMDMMDDYGFENPSILGLAGRLIKANMQQKFRNAKESIIHKAGNLFGRRRSR